VLRQRVARISEETVVSICKSKECCRGALNTHPVWLTARALSYIQEDHNFLMRNIKFHISTFSAKLYFSKNNSSKVIFIFQQILHKNGRGLCMYVPLQSVCPIQCTCFYCLVVDVIKHIRRISCHVIVHCCSSVG